MKRPQYLPLLILSAVAVCLFVAGFIVPPTGVIDGSVLSAGGILFAFAALWVAVFAISSKERNVRITHGDTSLAITSEDTETE